MQFLPKFLCRTKAFALCSILSFAVLVGCSPEDKVMFSSGEALVASSGKGQHSVAGNDVYANFAALVAAEPNAFQIDVRDVQTRNVKNSKTIILTPHGGSIEPGTTEIADAIADSFWGPNYDFYSFTGIKPNNNSTLHITSTNFDEPTCEAIVGVSTRTVAIHGCAGDNAIVYVSGRDNPLVTAISTALSNRGFTVSNNPPAHLSGTSINNICNRNATGKGVQIEISRGLREQMMTVLNTAQGRASSKTFVFRRFVRAVRSALMF